MLCVVSTIFRKRVRGEADEREFGAFEFEIGKHAAVFLGFPLSFMLPTPAQFRVTSKIFAQAGRNSGQAVSSSFPIAMAGALPTSSAGPGGKPAKVRAVVELGATLGHPDAAD